MIRFALNAEERWELIKLEKDGILSSDARIEMASRRACRLIFRETTWEFYRDKERELFLPPTFSSTHLPHIGRYAELRALEMMLAVCQGQEEDKIENWPKHGNAAVPVLSTKDRVDLAHLEYECIASGDVILEAVTRSWCRYFVRGDRWRFGSKDGGFITVSLQRTSRPLIHHYVRLRAREAVRAVRKGHSEATIIKVLSKEAKRRLHKLRQYEFKF